MTKSLIFFGSGPVGRATLEALIEAGFDIEAVITKPKPEHHHGDMPVLDFAQAKNLTIFTPKNEAELEDLFKTSQFKSPIGVVVDYGLMISPSIIKSFPLGIVNSHFSLLPRWRGADPITFAILSGETETGVSLMLIDPKLDEGQLLAQEKLTLQPDVTGPKLTDKLVNLSNKILIEKLPLYIEGKIKPYPQPKLEPSYSRRLTKQDGMVDWTKLAEQIEKEVRAYLGWPKSRAKIFGSDVILTKVRVASDKNDGDLVMPTGDGWLEIKELIAPSGRSMKGADFLRGYKK
ncbi:hypothetical protein A3F65_01625 [Candidatus Saccharibacteria bacterium RIFCSPHIGHO2_12_FULL_47_16b]|nr:MAG: hypothetical protein A3F65_01625 [Candidatus Saccharibacteria bacterium RIFCSPHIGHO2_12_FULL_47_16b]